jgi:hypothetical protein
VNVATEFEKRFQNFERIKLSSPLNQQSSTEGFLWLWLQDFGGNGMFIAAWKLPSVSLAQCTMKDR